MLRVYYEFIRVAFQSNIIYRVSTFFSILQETMGLFVHVIIWQALYIGNSSIATDVGSISLGDMITYVVICRCLSILIENNIMFQIENRIREGQIAIDLIRPVRYKMYVLTTMIGTNLTKIFFQLIPVLVLSIIFFQFSVPSFPHLILFIITGILGVWINFLITYIVGLLAFWYLRIWHFDFLLQGIKKVFAGAWFPLWFFPDILLHISSVLPFKFIYYVPISIYLEKYSIEESLMFVLQQFIWIGVLTILDKLLFKKCIKKLVIQGG